MILSNDSLDEFEIEEYLTPKNENPLNIELREKINCSNCSEQYLLIILKMMNLILKIV